jgi:hypothetical protein
MYMLGPAKQGDMQVATEGVPYAVAVKNTDPQGPSVEGEVQAPKGGKRGVSMLPDLPPFPRVKNCGESDPGGRSIKRSARRCNARRVQRSEKVEREALLVDAALKLGNRT